MVWLGLISYSIYLVHVPVLVLLPTLGAYPIQGSDAPGSLTRVIALAVPATIATSAAFYYLIERPFQASGKRGSRQPVPISRSPCGRATTVSPRTSRAAWAAPTPARARSSW